MPIENQHKPLKRCIFVDHCGTFIIFYNPKKFKAIWILECFLKICVFGELVASASQPTIWHLQIAYKSFSRSDDVILATCRCCPRTNWKKFSNRRSTLNSSIVSYKSGYRSFSNPWSSVGNKWCSAWSPKLVSTIKWFPWMSLRSTIESTWKIPQSMFVVL